MELTTVLLMYYLAFAPPAGKPEVALATYKFSGAEEAFKNYGEQFPKRTRALVANAALIGSGLLNNYITYTWSF